MKSEALQRAYWFNLSLTRPLAGATIVTDLCPKGVRLSSIILDCTIMQQTSTIGHNEVPLVAHVFFGRQLMVLISLPTPALLLMTGSDGYGNHCFVLLTILVQLARMILYYE